MDESVSTPVITRRLSCSSMRCLLERSVGVAAAGQGFPLVGQGAQGAAEHAPRFSRVDDLVDEASLDGGVRCAVPALVVVLQVGAQTHAFVCVFNSGQALAFEDGDGARRAD